MPLDNNKRIAKNTLALYIRMLFMMGITLYTSRVMLKVLGVEDFGIYNVVGGVVVLFAFLNTVMSSATQRFLSYDLGCMDFTQMRKTFSVSMTVHLYIVLAIILLSETVGVWFLNTQMDIPAERMTAANWVFQFSVVNCCLKTIRVPYNATIIAYEKMSFFAYMGILEVVLGLLAVYVLLWLPADKLALYAGLVCLVSLLVLLFYKLYCNRRFETSRYRFCRDRALFGRLMSFSGWSMFGGVATLGSQQGVNILLNVFFGVTVNAAMGIATQVGQGVYSLVSSFQTAFNPHMVKLYAQQEKEAFIDLTVRSSKISFYLLFILALPLMLNMDSVLRVWLGDVPPYAGQFCRLTIVYFLIGSVSSPLSLSVQATGDIKRYQMIVSLLMITIIPLGYLVLKLGFNPGSVLVVKVAVIFLTYIVQVFLLRTHIGLPVRKYLKETLLVPCISMLIAVPLPLWVYGRTSGTTAFLLSGALSVLTVGLSAWLIGMNRSERLFVKKAVRSKLHR